jgi:iron complex outermembrane receptor protein
MTFSQDHNEVNVAMRGVYASSQQKFLIVINGHVLNSRSYAAANPDFGISVDNIKRIEVLRGPASSLYGNGALTAVVRIVTKTPDDVPGVVASIGAGNFGQVKLTGLFGSKSDRGDLLAWGSFYRSAGQTIDVPAAQDYSRNPRNAEAILDGFRDPPSHDVGLHLKTKAFAAFVAHRYSKYIEPFSGGGVTGESYRYDDYQEGDGVGPGLGIGSFNLGVTHERTLGGGSTLRVRAYYDKTDVVGHLVADPSTRLHSLVSWREWDAGAVGEFTRSFTALGSQGTWTAGFQADFNRVFDSVLTTGAGGLWGNAGAKGGLLDLGDEKIYSGFFQVTHPFAEKWTANLGVRHDRKVRLEGDDVNAVSPGLAVVYQHDARSSVAVSYSGAFVDAPYWYRYNSLASYRGARTLQPEYLKSFQVTPAMKVSDQLQARLNLFVNSLDDLIWRNKNAGPSEPIYQNAGYLDTWGVEPEVTYTRGIMDLHANATFQRVRAADKYDVTGAEIQNVPSFTWNAILNVRPPAAAKYDMRINVAARYIGAQPSPVNITIGDKVFFEPDRMVEAAWLVNAGTRLERLWSTGWFLDARVYNWFNTDYEQGGSVSHPYPQPGLSTLVQIGRSF